MGLTDASLLLTCHKLELLCRVFYFPSFYVIISKVTFQFEAQEDTMLISNEERETIILERMPQVKYLARRVSAKLPSYIDTNDLISAGTVGLLDAMEKFDSSKGVLFKTYAELRIKGSILDSLRDLDWAPRSLRKMIQRLEVVHSELKGCLGREPSDKELADELCISIDELLKLRTNLSTLDIVSLDGFNARDEGCGKNWYESLITKEPVEDENNPPSLYEKSELRSIFLQEINRLPENQKKVVFFYEYQELTMKTISSLMGVNESRVSQLHTKAIVTLRKRLNWLRGGEKPINWKPISAKDRTTTITESDLLPINAIPGQSVVSFPENQRNIITPTISHLHEAIDRLKLRTNPRSLRELAILQQAALVCSNYLQ